MRSWVNMFNVSVWCTMQYNRSYYSPGTVTWNQYKTTPLSLTLLPMFYAAARERKATYVLHKYAQLSYIFHHNTSLDSPELMYRVVGNWCHHRHGILNLVFAADQCSIHVRHSFSRLCVFCSTGFCCQL